MKYIAAKFIFFIFFYSFSSFCFVGGNTPTSIETTTLQAEIVTNLSINSNQFITTIDRNDIIGFESKRKNVIVEVEEEKEVNEEEEEDEDDTCDERLSSFVRRFDVSPFLPDDYEQVSQTMHNVDICRQMTHINDTLSIVNRLVDYGRKFRDNTDLQAAIRYVSSIAMDRLFAIQISPQCSADIVNVFAAIRNQEIWALKFPDSFAHILPSGLLRGHISSFGEFDQCVEIKSPPRNDARHIYGQYCQLQLRSPLPPLSTYDASYETIFRSNSLVEKLLTSIKKNNFGNFIDDHLVLKAIEAVHAINNNIYHYGVCFPSTCSSEDIETIFNEFLYPIIKVPVRIEKRLCSTHKELTQRQLDAQQWTAIIGISALASLVALSTLYHLYLRHVHDHIARNDKKQISKTIKMGEQHKHSATPKNDHNHINGYDHILQHEIASKKNCGSKNGSFDLRNRLAVLSNANDANKSAMFDHLDRSNSSDRSVAQQFLLAFSAIQNTEKLFFTHNRFGVIDTIRLLLTFFVYCLQAFHFTAYFTTQMLRSLTETAPRRIMTDSGYWFARTPGIWIDGFMFTLGVMLIQSQFKRLSNSEGRFSYFTYIWKRWFRLSVSLIGTFFAIFLYPLIGDGPLWFINDQWLMPACKNPSSIASSFLYYSNWNAAIGNFSIKSTFPLCNPPTWFLSMSTQLYLLAPLIFIPLYRWPRFGLAVNVFVICISPIITLSPRLFWNIPTYYEATKFSSIRHGISAFTNYHTNPVQYVTSLSIGLFVGYLIKCKPTMRIIGGRFTEFALWSFSFISIPIIWIWHNTFFVDNTSYIIPETSISVWLVMSKFMLASSLGYITYMCCTGRGGRVNRILTLSTLQPLAKLSYGIYLLRVPTIFYRITSVRHTYEMHYYQMFQNIIIDFSITSVLAYFLHLLFEAPAGNIMKIFETNKLCSFDTSRSSSNQNMIDNNEKIESIKSSECNNVNNNSEDDISTISIEMMHPNSIESGEIGKLDNLQK